MSRARRAVYRPTGPDLQRASRPGPTLDPAFTCTADEDLLHYPAPRLEESGSEVDSDTLHRLLFLALDAPYLKGARSRRCMGHVSGRPCRCGPVTPRALGFRTGLSPDARWSLPVALESERWTGEHSWLRPPSPAAPSRSRGPTTTAFRAISQARGRTSRQIPMAPGWRGSAPSA